jgi:hypothetical protein
LDDLDALEPIYTPSIWLRALWGDFPVVVRAHSGALKKGLLIRAFLESAIYKRIRTRRGSKVAVVACARKLTAIRADGRFRLADGREDPTATFAGN